MKEQALAGAPYIQRTRDSGTRRYFTSECDHWHWCARRHASRICCGSEVQYHLLTQEVADLEISDVFPRGGLPPLPPKYGRRQGHGMRATSTAATVL